MTKGTRRRLPAPARSATRCPAASAWRSARRLNGQRISSASVLLGDGEMQEGSGLGGGAWASSHRLRPAHRDRRPQPLPARRQRSSVINIEPLADKWRAFGWEVHHVDGHDVEALTTLLREVKADKTRTQARLRHCPYAERQGCRLHGNRSPAGILATSRRRKRKSCRPRNDPQGTVLHNEPELISEDLAVPRAQPPRPVAADPVDRADRPRRSGPPRGGGNR